MTNAINNTDNTIDSRDVIARIEELEAERSEIEEFEPSNLLEVFDNSEEGQELTVLKVLAEQFEEAMGEDYAPDWKYGAQLIHEDYFETAIDEMVADCYTLPKDLPSWITITYDYDALKQDYTELDFDGQTYYVR